MIRTLTIAALLLAAGCDRHQQSAPARTAEAATAPAAGPAPPARTAVPSLAGQWTVVGAPGLAATFARGQVLLSEGCLRRAWSYTQKGNSVGFTTAPGGSSNCGRSPSAALDNAFDPLSEANLAVFSADGRMVTLSGLGGSLQLQRR